MKRILSYISITFILFLFTGCAIAENTEIKNAGLDILEVDMRLLFSLEYDRPENPNAEQLSIIRYVLKNTEEVHIHQMRGETDNTVYVNEDGREVVYDKDGNMVTNSYNQGTYNYYSNETEPIKKFIFDIAPWLKFGNTRDDPTTFEERLYHYTLDLDIGIQNYIFFGSDKTLEVVSFEELSENEKEVYYIFLELLFNENYSTELSRNNIQRLREDGDFYFQYFDQIQEALNVFQSSGTSADNSPASTAAQQNSEETAEGTASKDLPIDIAIASFHDETGWVYESYEHDLYSFELPESWQAVDGTEHGLVNGVFLVPPDTDMGNFRYSAHVAIEVLDSMPEGGQVPDFSSEDIQKEFFAAQIIQTYAKMGGLSDLEFSVWESEHGYVYIASFKRSNDQLSMYQTTYYVMNPNRMMQVQATYFGEDAVPAVNEVARHLINTFAVL